MTIEVYNDYLSDFIDLQLEKLKELGEEFQTCEKSEKDYLNGQIMAVYDSLTLLRSQADLFGIPLPKLESEDLEKYLGMG